MHDENYAECVRRGFEAVTAIAAAQWTLGDLALTVETEYGEGKLQRYANDIGVELKTLEQYRLVARSYREEDRSSDSPWTVHKVFASQEDRHELIAKGPWTTREAREHVRAARVTEEEVVVNFSAKLENLRRYTEDLIGWAEKIDAIVPENHILLIDEMMENLSDVRRIISPQDLRDMESEP